VAAWAGAGKFAWKSDRGQTRTSGLLCGAE
jgi:hypothetical protein